MKIKYYLVGGCVRDKLLGFKPKDWDFAVECSSFEEMKFDILRRGGTIFLEKPEFLTIRAKLDGRAADFTCCRAEGFYSDSRHPDSVTISDIKSDLARRDFTMNAIAEDADTGEVIDPHSGRFDIENKLIACVGNTKDRFGEDALRMIRAIRFAVTKNFQLHHFIVNFLQDKDFVKKLDNVSVERIREEMVKCFKFDTATTLDYLEAFPHLRKQIFNKDNKLILIPTIQG